MMSSRSDIALVIIGLCLCSIFANATKSCAGTCLVGPKDFYAEIGCKPIYGNCSKCPIRYDCNEWNNLPAGKCLLNGRTYDVNEKLGLGEISSKPCLTCTCKGNKRFSCHRKVCRATDGPLLIGGNCNRFSLARECCKSVTICRNNYPICNVDGVTYGFNEEFIPFSEHNKTCHCDFGYTGVNDENFCTWRKPGWCLNVINNLDKIRSGCSPVYASQQWLREPPYCPQTFRCPDAHRDIVIKSHTKRSHDPNLICRFGNLMLNIGDTVKTEEDSEELDESIVCHCHVPPLLTCHILVHS